MKPELAIACLIEDYVNNQNYLTSLTSIIQSGIMSGRRRHHRRKISRPWRTSYVSHFECEVHSCSVKLQEIMEAQGVGGWVLLNNAS